MNPIIIVPSVKHSGANILVKHLLKSYPPGTLKNYIEGGIIHDHVLYTKLPQFMALMSSDNTPVIIPIRHPKVVAKLWDRAGDELNPDFYQMWSAIQKFRERDNVQYLAMDTDDLPTRIEVVATNSELQFSAEMMLDSAEKVEMSMRAYQVRYEELTEGARVQELTDDLEDFLGNIYGATDPEEEPSKQDAEDARKKKARQKKAPKDTWKHACPIKEEDVFTNNGEVCKFCGAEE